VGDFFLDGYWYLNMSDSEPSVETGFPTLPVNAQQYFIGGAGTALPEEIMKVVRPS
jgi:bifunctional ADP-heptose synthase (sugar kinase/adenylyltransferase)